MNKKKKLLCWSLIATSAFVLTSCAEGFDGNETFETWVRNTQMITPIADSIKVTPSADGLKQTISWPAVIGAGGSEFALYDASNETPLVSQVVDGSSIIVDREEDVNYVIKLRTLGNKQYGNTDAADETTKTFSTFSVTYKKIPAPSEIEDCDLYKYFLANPVPESDTILYYDLEPGATYNLSQTFDFKDAKITMRSQSKSNPVNIKMAEGASFSTCGTFGLKYLNIDMTESSSPVVTMSKEPTMAPDEKGYLHSDAISLQSLDVKNLKNAFVYDSNIKYCLHTMLINNCFVKMKPSETRTAVIYFYGGGHVNDIVVRQSTFATSGEYNYKYFIQYTNGSNSYRAGLTSNSVSFTNNTFYNVAHVINEKGEDEGQWTNWSGFGPNEKNVSLFSTTGNIFYDCGGGQIARRIIIRYLSEWLKYNPSIKFDNNTYWYKGAAEKNNTLYDSGYQLQTDPAFVDPANNDFTPTGAEQLEKKTGDPRWLK